MSEAPAPLDPEQRRLLLRTARRAIAHHLATGQTPLPDTGDPALLQPRGAFVTLREGPRLRGCIGTLEARRPLVETVARMAVAAATGDPRFPPVTPEELPRLTVEISALTPLRPARPEEVVVGRHGVVVSAGPARGVLLPQVPVEAGWDRETLLAQTCRKAGLPPDCWRRPGTRLEVFSAEVFDERGEGLLDRPAEP